MMPTISPQDMCIVNPLAYSTGEIQRFDIIIFEMPESVKQTTGSKGEVRVMMRIIGLPGERIEIREKQVLVNDQILDQPFERIESDFPKHRNFGPIVVPTNEYFVLGDNRENSLDSRYYKHPTIHKKTIYSKVTVIKKGYYAGN
jgi:signal peptidase I